MLNYQCLINWTKGKKKKNRGYELRRTSCAGPNRLLSICDFDANNNTNGICIAEPREICGHICSQYAARDGVEQMLPRVHHRCQVRRGPPPEITARLGNAADSRLATIFIWPLFLVWVGGGEEEHLHDQHKARKGQREGSVITCASD